MGKYRVRCKIMGNPRIFHQISSFPDHGMVAYCREFVPGAAIPLLV
jgi:hypothetical protein